LPQLVHFRQTGNPWKGAVRTLNPQRRRYFAAFRSRDDAVQAGMLLASGALLLNERI